MPLPDRKTAFLSALEEGPVMVALAIDVPDVDVPTELAKDGVLHLRYSYSFRNPMQATDDGIDSTLSFSGVHQHTFVPWGAVLAVIEETTGTMIQWPRGQPVEKAPPKTKVKKPTLRIVK